MSDENTEILKEMSHKLDQLIALWKLNNRETLEKFEREIKKDKVFSKILEYADGSLSYSELSKKVADETKFAEITVKQKLSALKDKGVLITKRKGREVYYENSGLLD
ncbi:MAG: BlaI/MecI/CopY family transcriptional regulator [Methanophagales archaeon]|nr:BlaI/MecI/CopY family transcriptional regulator [Methanophagales archaeon]MCW7073798.1 BlaI/MecI/CopY family transcriptional regulator [Methanophagales archaeon]